ncbi:amidohydrolase family protein [Bradyrhizobium sp. 21]|uniref:amidohydrolase family protein n=1 Tax=Bradyrhizobium sp. 21 TaxID=2782666 RepID=UPI001FFA80EB|nr:amidohydrolase family protein [Bradyrhizobium sp. 21]MCK1385841.1 amidohydrolase family protein [Bradyrhizobium sp. 21]
MSPAAGPKRWALTGRIVTMAAEGDVIENGTIFIEDNRIAGIAPKGQPAPAGFEAVQAIKTGGSIYPGLIELHNHLSYNILPLWRVPQAFGNRDQWQNAKSYKTSVTGPMSAIALADDGSLLPALVRYVEAKCLVAGTTTSQGITLSNWSGTIHKYYKGALRAAEIGSPPDLPRAHSKIPDIDAKDWAKFNKELKSSACFLLHLSEGIDTKAHSHFLALRNAAGDWAIEPSLAGIHCTALEATDFGTMAQHQAKVVWSPLSNLLLYGKTTDVAAARTAGLTIALGSDWSPSGSKNLLGELKAAKVVSAHFGLGFSDYEIVSMATRNPAAILKWDGKLGTIAAGKFADLLVVKGSADDPYGHLIGSREQDIVLVTIGGRPRYGTKKAMQQAGASGEALDIGSSARLIDFTSPDQDPGIEKISLAEATTRLSAALGKLGTLQQHSVTMTAAIASGTVSRTGWRLALDEQFGNNVELRPRLDYNGSPTGPDLRAVAAAAEPLHPIKLDALTVVDDRAFLETLTSEPNLPQGLATAIAAFY